MSKIRICYAVTDISTKTFMIIIPKDSTSGDLLELISKKQSKRYEYLYCEGSEVDKTELVNDFLELSPNAIFIASTESSPPSSDFNISIQTSKGLVKPTPEPPVKIKSPIKQPPKVSPVSSMKTPPKQFSPSKVSNYTPNEVYGNREIDKTLMHHEHEGGIFTEEISVQRAVDGKYKFYFTGGSKEFMLEGIEIELNTSMTPNQARDYLQEQLYDKIDMKGKQLIVYLPCGLPFISGTLGEVFLNKNFKFSNVIYGIVTRKVSESILNSSYPELCNIDGNDRKLLISPLCESTQLGLSDMACLLGYLNHDGVKGDLLLRTCAAVTNFAPLITSMNNIICRNGVTGRDVITVTSSLYTFFRAYIPSTTKDEKVYEYALRLCNLISHINNPPDSIPINAFEVIPDDPKSKFLSNLKLGPIVNMWKADIGEAFKPCSFQLQGEDAIINAYNIIASFKPIAPLSIRLATGCAIVRGKDHEYLYLMQSSLKKAEFANFCDIIDPLTGHITSIDVEKFAIEQEDTRVDNVEDLIDPDNVSQIIMVDFDESGSMTTDLNGHTIKDKDTFSRFEISYQYMTTFANRTYGYRIPCIQGLISFGNKVNLRCPLSPLCPDFEDKGLKKIQPQGVTKLWDSLDMACDEIIKFRTDSEGKEKFKNAVSRIIVISDGEDYRSTSKPKDIVKKLIQNHIIVDCVIASATDYCKELSSFCHMTGGLSFRPENISDGLALFEKGAFLNYSERKPSTQQVIKTDKKTTPKKIAADLSVLTDEFMEKAKNDAYFDNEVLDKNILLAQGRENLATPAHHCSINQKKQVPSPRNRRILRELHRAAEATDNGLSKKDEFFDPDMKIFTLRTNMDRWKVFIKGPENTPYEGKWWYLLVTFPELYPIQAPVIRFVSIPYHLNVSSEGRICLNCLEKGYISSKHVVDILQEIKEIFLLPHPESAIQMEKLDLFKNNPKEYEELAKKSTNDNAKDNYTDYIYSNIDDTVEKGFQLEVGEHVPPYMLSQISGRKILDPVIASTKVIYDREELRQLVASSRNPICIITGERIENTLDEIDSL